MRRTITVRLRASVQRSYPIIVAPGALRRIPRVLEQMFGKRDVFIITDATVARLYGRRVLNDLTSEGWTALLLDVPPGETSKSSEIVFALHTQLLMHGIRRDSLILALGGGVVGDVAGFVASTVLRGVRCVQVPTTLLAQVDSSVGGKVGIDHPLGKNLIGAFHQPAAVLIDPTVLQTLPVREFRNGLAELIKIAVALDPRLFGLIRRSASKLTRTSSALLTRLIAAAVELKAAVVEQDEFEHGVRKTLNLGHTIGHALEAASGFSTPHGVAVAMGLVAESAIAVRMGVMEERTRATLLRALHAVGLPTRIPRIANRAAFYAALGSDKKRGPGGVEFVLLRNVGSVVVGVHVPTSFIEEAVPLS